MSNEAEEADSMITGVEAFKKVRQFSRYTMAVLLFFTAAVFDGAPSYGSAADLLQLPDDFRSRRQNAQEWVEPGSVVTVFDAGGAGCVRHFWTTFNGAPASMQTGMFVVMRIYTDKRETPDVEVPVSAFFGHFHDRSPGRIDSPYLQVNEGGGLNSYFPMPFQNGMRITLENQTDRSLDLYFQGDYQEYTSGTLTEKRRFHALYRRVNPTESYGKPYLIGRGKGRGFLAGVSMGMTVMDRHDAWYHNGGDLILIDGETSHPGVLNGIGGEDFFGYAYGMSSFSNGQVGSPYYDLLDGAPTFLDYGATGSEPESESVANRSAYLKFAAYRQFHADPVVFDESFVMTFGAFANDMSSVLYWYQDGEQLKVSSLPMPEDRLGGTEVPEGKYLSPVPETFLWQVCGPFRCESREDFERAEFPELRRDFAESQPADFGYYAFAETKGKTATETRWHRDIPGILGFVDLRPYHRMQLPTNFAFPKDVSAYAYTTITSEGERWIRVRIGHDDWLRFWLNGELIYDGPHEGDMESTDIPVLLKEGRNEVLLKVANSENSNLRAWVYQFVVLDE